MIVFCYDGSEESKRAMRVAAELLADREAVVVDVVSVFTGPEGDEIVTPDPDGPLLLELNRDAALEVAGAGVELARELGFSADRRAVFAGPVWEGVVAVADEVDAGVIVAGPRGVSRDLARHAHRPVLLI